MRMRGDPMDYQDIFQKSCLVQLSTSVWQCSRVLNQRLIDEKLGEEHGWLKGRKNLINPELLGPVKTAVHQARNHVQKFSLPFPITSIYLIPKDSLSQVDDRLNYFKSRFWDRVQDFEDVYDVALEEAQSILGDLFNETEYPTDISQKFKFEWRYLSLSIPQKASILTPEIYEREKQKFQELMEETREVSMIALREEFGQIVELLVNRLNGDGTPRMLNNKMFNKLTEFLSEFDTKNIFDDQQLAELTDEARSVIGGITPHSIKYNDAMRQEIHNEFNTLKEAINASIEDMPRRRIRLVATA